MLEALRGRAETIGLELTDIEGIDPPRFALVRHEEVDGNYALTNDDGLPVFTFQEAQEFIKEIERYGSFENWRDGVEKEESFTKEDVVQECMRRLERSHLRAIHREAVYPTSASDQNLRDEIRVVVIQELLRHKLIESRVPFDGEIIPPEKH